jgi:hypothetical protein
MGDVDMFCTAAAGNVEGTDEVLVGHLLVGTDRHYPALRFPE